jgi:protein-disulfide isomerase
MSALKIPVSDRDHVAGSPDAPVVLVEYGDFECPYCGRAYPIVKEAQESLGSTLAVVYRHFPLAESHPYATLAAEASEAAAAQNAFWPMHDLLFEHQDALDEQSLIAYADALQLDIERFERELADRVYLPKVRGDFRGGVRSGVNATPTFFVNGSRYDRDWSNPSFFIAVLGDAAGAQAR